MMSLWKTRKNGASPELGVAGSGQAEERNHFSKFSHGSLRHHGTILVLLVGKQLGELLDVLDVAGGGFQDYEAGGGGAVAHNHLASSQWLQQVIICSQSRDGAGTLGAYLSCSAVGHGTARTYWLFHFLIVSNFSNISLT